MSSHRVVSRAQPDPASQRHAGERQTSEDPGRAAWRPLVELAIVLAAAVFAAIITGTTDVLVVVAAIVAMVMIHELGHFLTAKWSGMKVTEYFLGFGPRLWSVRWGETEYGVKAIPAGGYVKIVGMTNLEEVDPEDEPRSYRQKPFRNRLLVAVAGSAMHFVMAFVLIWVLLAVIGVPGPGKVEIQGLTPWQGMTSPAERAGLAAGETIVAVDGRHVSTLSEVAKVTGSHVGRRITLEIRKGGTTRDVALTPVDGRHVLVGGRPVLPAGTRDPGLIGVDLTYLPVTSGPLEAVGQSATGLVRTLGASIGALGHVFSPSGLARYVTELSSPAAARKAARQGTRPESIYGAVRTAVQGAQAGVGDLLVVLISINVFIGVVNLFPMLPLDGGHVAVAVYERIRSRRGRPYRADVGKLLPVAYLMIAFLGFVFLSSLYLDITHPVANPFH
ncbi:MAG: M50 family metallopeptidase [Actinomycetota bacterium]|jgi:membrane-associated protease RseP (regulator of RpoE activity)|nr:M50 family metallopeptidase [Actinomycetota bacterium]